MIRIVWDCLTQANALPRRLLILAIIYPLFLISSLSFCLRIVFISSMSLQFFDAVGRATGRASGLSNQPSGSLQTFGYRFWLE